MSLSPFYDYCDHCRLHADACHCQTCINPQCGEWVALKDDEAPNEGRCKWCGIAKPAHDTLPPSEAPATWPCPPPTEPMPALWRAS